jgi:hypothetical protein
MLLITTLVSKTCSVPINSLRFEMDLNLFCISQLAHLHCQIGALYHRPLKDSIVEPHIHYTLDRDIGS